MMKTLRTQLLRVRKASNWFSSKIWWAAKCTPRARLEWHVPREKHQNSHYSSSMTAARYSVSPFHTTHSSLLRKAVKLRAKTRFSNTHGIKESLSFMFLLFASTPCHKRGGAVADRLLGRFTFFTAHTTNNLEFYILVFVYTW